MVKHKSEFWIAVMTCACIFFLSHATDAVGQDTVMKQLRETVAQVRKGKTSRVRTDAAQHLAKLTNQLDPNDVDDATISEIVSLLDMSEDSVRLWVAGSLGKLGPRAKKLAASRLLELLPEVDCLEGSLTSAGAIRVALQRMGVTPPPENCATQGKSKSQG